MASEKEMVIRNYRHWEGTNRFYCDGNVMTGPNPKALLFTFLLVTLPGIVFAAFPLAYYAQNGAPIVTLLGVLLQAVSTILLMVTALSDPGYIPRQVTKNRPNPKRKGTYDVLLRSAELVKLKYCHTCNVFRPPRAVHCSICDCCVERMDHHCPWVGTCVGKRNYLAFFLFINSTLIYSVFVLIVSATHISHVVSDYRETHGEEHARAFELCMRESPLSLPLILYATAAFFFLAALCLYHYLLVCRNKTTNEDLKKSMRRLPRHPYDMASCTNNAAELLCANVAEAHF